MNVWDDKESNNVIIISCDITYQIYLGKMTIIEKKI